jgi:hypothetical protein
MVNAQLEAEHKKNANGSRLGKVTQGLHRSYFQQLVCVPAHLRLEALYWARSLVPPARIELATPPLPRVCSTPELRRQIVESASRFRSFVPSIHPEHPQNRNASHGCSAHEKQRPLALRRRACKAFGPGWIVMGVGRHDMPRLAASHQPAHYCCVFACSQLDAA